MNQREKTFSVLLVNLRGFKSKKFSLEKALKSMKPSMIAMNETQIGGKNKSLPAILHNVVQK